MVRLLIAAALAGISLQSAPAAAPTLPDADPAIWVVNDDDTIIFLFGTFHALDGNSDWFNDEVKTAFVSAEELVLETIAPAAPARTRGGARRPSAGPPEPFLASTRIAVSAIRANGMRVEMGADEVLRKAAEAAGKPVEGLEAFEDQLSMFARIPAPNRSSRSGYGFHQMQSTSSLMGWMQAAWNRGDEKVFAGLVEQLRQSSPETYRVMFTERNENWAGWIAERLERPGTVFVAVGAGHLAGRDSIQVKLAELGVRSERLS